MIRRFVFPLAVTALMVMIIVSITSAVAAGNTVPPSHLGQTSQAITANALKPAACAALNLTNIVVCPAAGGACTGTAANDLILGSSNVDTIKGKGGNDCIIGGGGNDNITGGAGTNVCIGHVGDTYTNCQTIINQ